jgi:HTH-type transcriptional regulator / antitoxin HipB
MRQPITNPSQVAEILRGRRKARHLSQHELATKLGLSQARLSVLEGDASSLSLDRLLLLAKLLGLELVIQDKADEPKSKAQW